MLVEVETAHARSWARISAFLRYGLVSTRGFRGTFRFNGIVHDNACERIELHRIPRVIEELIQLAKDMRQASQRGDALGLTDDEVAFYDALETNDSAVKVLGDEALRAIARELVATVRANVTIDWAVRENVRAQLRALVKRILRKHGYPPDKQEQATRTVLEQAEVLSEQWAVA